MKESKINDMDFDKSKYKAWTWKHPYILHWMINPGLAFNELVLGQKVPKITLIEKSNKPLTEKSFIPCPHCGTIHSGLKWAYPNKTAFGNWFGLYCDHCNKIIPCIWNLTSLVILVVTFPIWIWFKNSWKEKWLAKQKQKFSQPLNLQPPVYNWWYMGLSFAFVFLVIDSILKFRDFTWKGFLIDIPGSLFTAFLFVLMMKWMIGKQMRKSSKDDAQRTI